MLKSVGVIGNQSSRSSSRCVYNYRPT